MAITSLPAAGSWNRGASQWHSSSMIAGVLSGKISAGVRSGPSDSTIRVSETSPTISEGRDPTPPPVSSLTRT